MFGLNSKAASIISEYSSTIHCQRGNECGARSSFHNNTQAADKIQNWQRPSQPPLSVSSFHSTAEKRLIKQRRKSLERKKKKIPSFTRFFSFLCFVVQGKRKVPKIHTLLFRFLFFIVVIFACLFPLDSFSSLRPRRLTE